MERILLIISCVVSGLWLNAQNLSQTALQLAARRVEHSQADIPLGIAHEIQKALDAFMASTDSKVLEVKSHNIEIYEQVNLKNLNLWLAEDSPLAKLYSQDLQASTSLSAYLEPYALEVSGVEFREGTSILQVEARSPINMRYLANELSMQLEVDLIEVPMPKHKTSDISIRMLNGNDWVLYYHLFVEGDGLEKGYHVWEFSYSQSEGLHFVAEYGPQLP